MKDFTIHKWRSSSFELLTTISDDLKERKVVAELQHLKEQLKIVGVHVSNHGFKPKMR